jgi:hypothetical protein
MFARPNALDHFVLMRINLDKGAGPDQRIQCAVLGSHVSIEYVARASVLCKKERHFTQALEHSMDKVRPFQEHFVWQFHGRRHYRLHLRNGAWAEVSVRQRDQASFMVQITDVKAEHRQDFDDIAPVDEAEAVELREAGFRSPVFEVTYPIVRHKVSRVLFLFYNSPAESLDIADGQLPLLALRAETLASFGT